MSGAHRRDYIDVRKVSLKKWLELMQIPKHKRKRPFIYFMFPTDDHRDDYLRTIARRSNTEVRELLRSFMIPSGRLGSDERLMFSQSDEASTGEFFRRWLSGEAWEGTTWILDLLPDHPRKAVAALDAYRTAHISFLPDGRYRGLADAIAVIRAKYFTHVSTRKLLLELLPDEFEHLIASLYSKMGFRVRVTAVTGDGGYDIEAIKAEAGERIFIECKKHKATIGVKDVRALAGTVGLEDATQGVLVTTSSFSRPAREFASSIESLTLVDFHALLSLLNEQFGSQWYFAIETHVDQGREASSGQKALPFD